MHFLTRLICNKVRYFFGIKRENNEFLVKFKIEYIKKQITEGKKLSNSKLGGVRFILDVEKALDSSNLAFGAKKNHDAN